jgi:predicted aminopeptidase
MLESDALSEELRERLMLVLEAREFATSELDLPDNKSYRTYKQLERAYAVWTVVATPELSLTPLQWCFPIAGCVTYRGYFSQDRARQFAHRLSDQGFDVDVGGVAAYSTLGWFADPVLSTFIWQSEPELVGLIVHELAHQRLYVKDDTRFNESFAATVEMEGVRRWLGQAGREDLLEAYNADCAREQEFVALVTRSRDRLQEVYLGDRSNAWKRQQKVELLEALRDEFREASAHWPAGDDYQSWFGEGLNNARLASVGEYADFVPAFKALLQRCDRRLDCFYAQAERLALLDSERRIEELTELGARVSP